MKRQNMNRREDKTGEHKEKTRRGKQETLGETSAHGHSPLETMVEQQGLLIARGKPYLPMTETEGLTDTWCSQYTSKSTHLNLEANKANKHFVTTEKKGKGKITRLL